jgi:ligand-binding SRPBCC domain-containing protein
MADFFLHQELWLPRRRESVFPFFAEARNLEILTPSWLHFKILDPFPMVMRTGTRIDYKLRLRGLPMRWQREITVWDPPSRFVDEQRRGPYRRWIHEHCFEEHEQGTRCVDHRQYAVIGGTLVEKFFVRRDLERIFAFRRAKRIELFA